MTLVLKPDKTAIIVTSQGYVFTGWYSHCSISPSGCESYFSRPEFGKPELRTIGQHDLLGFGQKPGDTYWTDKPHVFSSRRSAERAMKKLWCMFGEMAVVD